MNEKSKKNENKEDKKSEADTTSQDERKDTEEKEEITEEIIVSESTKKMVTIDRWKGVPRAYYPDLINVLEEMNPAITEEIHQKAISGIVRRHSNNRGSAATDLKQIRALFNRYSNEIKVTVPGLFTYVTEKLSIFKELLLHMEEVKKKWEEESNRNEGNVRFVKELSK